MNRDHSVAFETAPKYCISDSFQIVDFEGYSTSSKGFLPTVVDIMVIWIKFSYSLHLVHWFLKCQCSFLPSPVWPIQFTLIHGPNIAGTYAIFFFTASDFTSPPDTSTRTFFLLSPSQFILSGAISNCPPLFPRSIGHLLTWEAHLPVSYLCAFSWGSHGKNTGVIFHSLLQWTMFCQNSSLWPVCLGWPCTAWLIASLIYTSSFTVTSLWSIMMSIIHGKIIVFISKLNFTIFRDFSCII